MRGFAVLLAVLVAIFTGYTYLQVTRLQTDVAQLRTKMAQREAHGSVAGGQDAARLLKDATESAKQAKIALSKGQTGKAKRELDVSLQKLSEASKLAAKNSGKDDITETWKRVSGQIDKLWKQFAKQNERK